jgi:signal transduction histidine kinase
LRQLFANLISNAIDATPSGGDICVKCIPAMGWSDGGRNGVRVVVADSGSGIPDAVKRRIFEPFVTTKGDAGTGLGLWVCDDIVKRHGGALKLKSRTINRSGTVFSVFLPGNHSPAPQASDLSSVSDGTLPFRA